MEYVAIKPGFRDGSLIPEGGTFEAEDFKGSWAVEKTAYAPEKPEPEEDLIAKAKEALQGRRAASGKKPGKRKAPK